MVKRCVSTCNKLKKEECVKPCSLYGKKYCRLHPSMTMRPPDCRVVTKTKKMTKSNSKSKSRSATPNSALEMLKKMMINRETPKSNTPKSNTPKKNTSKSNTPKRTLKIAAKKIAAFMKRTEARRKEIFGNAICSDKGICIGFGKQKKRQMDFFQFDTFEHAILPAKTLGKTSANGFVKEFKFEKDGFSSYAVLKSSLRKESDNIAYEYLVGKYLNEVSKRLPNFVETYGLYYFENIINRRRLQTNDIFASGLNKFEPEDLHNVCSKSSTQCVLIQHLKDATTILEHVDESNMKIRDVDIGRFYLIDAPTIFYQIYFALSQLKKEFTHYDLHCSNMMLFEPVKGGHIDYYYHLPGRVVTFPSRYIVKMIDYGRCFFKGNDEYYEKVCQESTCNPNCGYENGFSLFNKDFSIDNTQWFINPLHKNESHDLKLMKHFEMETNVSKFNHYPQMTEFCKIFEDTVYGEGLPWYESSFGTIEYTEKSNLIRNVSDAHDRWEKFIMEDSRKNMIIRKYGTSTKIGELHVYTDGRELEFIP